MSTFLTGLSYTPLRMSEVVTLYNWQTDEQTQIEGSAGSIFWSADSSQLLFSRPPGLFLQVDVATKEHVTLAETAVTPIFPTRWHNEGQATLLHGRNDDVLYELDLATQSVRPLFIPSEPQEDEDKRSLVRPYDQTAVSPDNQMVAFSWRNQLWLASLTEPTEPILLYEDERITTLLWSPDSQQLLFMTQQDCLPNTSCLNTLHLASTTNNTIEQVLDLAMSSTYTPELLFWLP